MTQPRCACLMCVGGPVCELAEGHELPHRAGEIDWRWSIGTADVLPAHCGECGEEFHLDDTGGYNPPCRCGFACRSCCDANCVKWDDEPPCDDSDDFDSANPDEADPTMPGWIP